MSEELMSEVVRLAVTDEDKRQAREVLLGLLARGADDWIACQLADGLVRLDPTDDDKRQALDELLNSLAHQTRYYQADQDDDYNDDWQPGELVAGIVRLDPTADERCSPMTPYVAGGS